MVASELNRGERLGTGTTVLAGRGHVYIPSGELQMVYRPGGSTLPNNVDHVGTMVEAVRKAA